MFIPGLLALLLPASSPAAVSTFGSPLSVPATQNTNELGYLGTYTQVPPSPEAPSGVVHTAHWGADTALWNVGLAAGMPAAPATGQALKVSLEGCAERAAGGPRPLTQIHFQSLSPLAGGGARVNISSQAFDIPVCGEGGASGSTITTYTPINLCVAKGDYVGLNEEGGFEPNYYRSGVPYQVIGAVQGSTMDSFIRNNGVGNGTTMSPGETGANDGFASNKNMELMLQITLGTGPDATHICAGGSAGLPPTLAPIRIRPQTDGVNHSQNVSVAIYCRPPSGCSGVASLGLAGKTASYGHRRFNLRGNKTGHLPIHISSKLMKLIRRHHGASVLLTLVMGGQTFSQTIQIKIL
jgi:hypothetical protein